MRALTRPWRIRARSIDVLVRCARNSRALWPTIPERLVILQRSIAGEGSLSAIRRRLGLDWKRLFRHAQWNIGILPVPIGSLVRPGAYSDSAIEWFPLDN